MYKEKIIQAKEIGLTFQQRDAIQCDSHKGETDISLLSNVQRKRFPRIPIWDLEETILLL